MIPLQELHTERERLVRILTAVERLIAIPLRDSTLMPTDWELRVDECYGATPSILVTARTSGKEGAA